MFNVLSRRQLLATGTALSCPANVQASVTGRSTSSPPMQKVVLDAVRFAVESGDIPGVVAQVWRNGELCVDASAGWQDIERKLPMLSTTLFRIASMTKPVTVALALQLVDEGRLRLDDPIMRWMPEFARMRVLRRLDGPLDDTVAALRDITVEDLMTHRAGFAYGFMAPPPFGAELLKRMGYGIESCMTPDEWVLSLSQLPLVNQPGERFNYGHAVDVLGFLVARVMGKDLAAAMHEKLFAPLGMADTGFWVPPEKRERLTAFYMSPQAGQFTCGSGGAFTAERPAVFASGGQGLVSTAADYMRFARMLLHDGVIDGVRVLKVETARRMRANHFTAEQRRFPFVAGAPFNQGFGLGMSVVIDAKQPGVVSGSEGTFGWPGAFGGWWQADPRQDMALVWLQQCTPAPTQAGAPMPRLPGMQSAQRFRAAVYDVIQGGNHANAAG
jgi:CubicO group peptidase (beta-lactamase class C family)